MLSKICIICSRATTITLNVSRIARKIIIFASEMTMFGTLWDQIQDDFPVIVNPETRRFWRSLTQTFAAGPGMSCIFSWRRRLWSSLGRCIPEARPGNVQLTARLRYQSLQRYDSEADGTATGSLLIGPFSGLPGLTWFVWCGFQTMRVLNPTNEAEEKPLPMNSYTL